VPPPSVKLELLFIEHGTNCLNQMLNHRNEVGFHIIQLKRNWNLVNREHATFLTLSSWMITDGHDVVELDA